MRCFFFLLFLPGSLAGPLSMTSQPLEAWKGSCVFISCSIEEEHNGRPVNQISFAWYFNPVFDETLKDYDGTLLYNSNQSSAKPESHNGVAFVGDLRNRNCSLKISQLRRHDSGIYGIRVYWREGSLPNPMKWLQTVRITVSESPSELIQTVSPSMKEGQIYELVCSVPYTCFHEPIMLTIQGLEDHRLSPQKMTSETQKVQTQLFLNSTWKDHRKQLTCLLKTHNGNEIKKKFAELEVKYVPKGVRLQADPGVTVREGDKLSLKCVVNSSNPDVISYQWLKDGEIWYGWKGSSKKWTSSTQDIDSGNYTCRAFNVIGSMDSENLIINVQYQPKISILMPQSPIKENDNVVLSCSATGNPPISAYQWYKSSTPGIISTKKELRFEAIQASNSDTYYCAVQNNIGKSNSSVTLNVHYCPKDVQLFHLNRLPIKEGEKVILNCSVGSSFPSNSLYNFLKSETYIRKHQPLPLLQFFATATPDTSYRCEACNFMGCTLSPPISLKILFGPKDVKLHQEPPELVTEGNSVRLNCTVRMANPPKVSYTWYKDGQLLPLNSTENIIFIRNANSTDSGIYYCISRNIITDAESLPIRLDVHYGPRNVHLTLDTQKTVTEGMDVYLRCDNNAYPLAIVYKWYWKGQEILRETSKILTLKKIKVEQSGEYLCKAANHVSEKESQLMTISVSYSKATVMKRTLIGLGVFLAIIILLGVLLYGLKTWKKTIHSNIGSPQRSGSFFVRKAKREVLSSNNCRLNEGRVDRLLAFQNEEQEGTISYARLQFPPAGSKECTIYSSVMWPNLAPDSSDDKVIYSVVKKPGLPTKNDTRVDYENVVNKEEELHYSSLVNLALLSHPIKVDLDMDSESEDSIQYAALKH